MMNKHLVTAKHQSGVVLVISLIMLLALTLIGVTSSSVTGLEQKMAANTKDINLAFQAAEAALRDVETTLPDKKPTFEYGADTTQGKGGLYSLLSADCSATGLPVTPRVDTTTPSLRPFDSKVDWNGTKVATYDNTTTKKLAGLYQPPKYIIEEVSCTPLGSSAGNESLEAGGSVSSSSETEVRMRITARGWGSNANSVATVQSIVKITYKNAL
ncbi:MAG: PilX N-terminal domain-containing pilus assembly protein [Methylococcales bacterium]|nr:PilX N-terminal domain-containing pilus assembly protein [Methylococcales bacterium]MDP3838344.1 PilX N-terminal domain-containing pilus assembly protein [Methylococcales bacterium]